MKPFLTFSLILLAGCWLGGCWTTPVDLREDTLVPELVLLGRLDAPPHAPEEARVVTRDGVLEFALEGETLVVTDRLNEREVARAPLDAAATAIALTPDDVCLVAVCTEADELLFVNTASFEVVTRVTEDVGPEPVAIAFTPDGVHGLVANRRAETLSVLDLADRRIVGEVAVGPEPTSVWIEGDEALVACGDGTTAVLGLPEPSPLVLGRPNEVVVLGTLNGLHLESSLYGLDVLEDLVRAIEPDYVLAEIPPNRFERAMQEYRERGVVEEERVARFPEYVDVLFPLTREMDFTIIPTAAWSEPVATYSATVMSRLQGSDEASWSRYEEARAASADAITSGGAPDDPRWIHTDAFDEAAQEELAVYDELFNDRLGPGGWSNANRASYANIARALDEHSGEGKRFLVTYGAYYKGWLLGELRQRDDVVLLDVGPFLDAIGR